MRGEAGKAFALDIRAHVNRTDARRQPLREPCFPRARQATHEHEHRPLRRQQSARAVDVRLKVTRPTRFQRRHLRPHQRPMRSIHPHQAHGLVVPAFAEIRIDERRSMRPASAPAQIRINRNAISSATSIQRNAGSNSSPSNPTSRPARLTTLRQ